jgi:hypothetical protein
MTTRTNVASPAPVSKRDLASEIEAGTDYTCWPPCSYRKVDIWEANRKARAVMATLPDDVIEAICMIGPRRLQARGRCWVQLPQTMH